MTHDQDDGSDIRSRRREVVDQLPAFLRDLLPGDTESPDGDGRAPVVDDLEKDDRDLVQALVDLGVSQDDACRAVVTGRVPLVLAQQRWREEGRHDLDEVARRSGLPTSIIEDLYMAMGLLTPGLFSKSDLQWLRHIHQFLDVMSVDALMSSARVRGTALSMIARADLAMARDELLVPMRQAGADDLTMAVALAEATARLEEIGKEALVHGYETQLRAQMDGELVAAAARTSDQEVDIAVGFVDVEGYTALSARIDPSGLDAVIDAFERRVQVVTSREPGVSPVKYLGDAAMLVSADPAELAGVLLDLTQPVDELADAPLRAGMAFGPVLVRDGDYFGTTVNLAARLTDQARAWKVLAADELRHRLREHFVTHRVKPMRMRGIGTRRPIVILDRLETADEPDHEEE